MHTPGPWIFFTERESTPDRPNTMKFLKGSDGQGFAHTVGLSEPTDTANARLIAAAPELLEALKKARNAYMMLYAEALATDRDIPLICKMASDERVNFDAIIAKAEGKP